MVEARRTLGGWRTAAVGLAFFFRLPCSPPGPVRRRGEGGEGAAAAAGLAGRWGGHLWRCGNARLLRRRRRKRRARGRALHDQGRLGLRGTGGGAGNGPNSGRVGINVNVNNLRCVPQGCFAVGPPRAGGEGALGLVPESHAHHAVPRLDLLDGAPDHGKHRREGRSGVPHLPPSLSLPPQNLEFRTVPVEFETAWFCCLAPGTHQDDLTHQDTLSSKDFCGGSRSSFIENHSGK